MNLIFFNINKNNVLIINYIDSSSFEILWREFLLNIFESINFDHNLQNKAILIEENVQDYESFEKSILGSKIKIIDFGFVREVTDDGKQISFCGSLFNMPPEIWEEIKRSAFPQRTSHFKKFDTWSLGCCVFRLFTGQYPFVAATTDDLIITLKDGKYYYDCYLKPRIKFLDFI